MYWFGLTKSNLDFWMIFGQINSAVEKISWVALTFFCGGRSSQISDDTSRYLLKESNFYGWVT